VKDSAKKTVVKSNAEEAAKPAPKDTPATVPPKNTEKDKKDNAAGNNTKQPAGAAAAGSSSTKVDTDEFLYKAAMVYQRQGDLNEAINRYKRLSDGNSSRIGEMARYQMAICYRDKGQTGKAKRMLKDVIRMDGSMKKSAQQLLDSL
jgi:TolA-binding protein